MNIDLFRRGMTVPVLSQRHGLKLLIEDCPYAVWAFESEINILTYKQQQLIGLVEKAQNATAQAVFNNVSIDSGYVSNVPSVEPTMTSRFPVLNTQMHIVAILLCKLFVATGLSQSSPSRYATEQLLRADGSLHIRGSQMQSQPIGRNMTPKLHSNLDIFLRYSEFRAQNAAPRSIAALKGTTADAQRATSDSMKRKLKPDANSNVFERYSHLCARNVNTTVSDDVIPQHAVDESQLHEQTGCSDTCTSKGGASTTKFLFRHASERFLDSEILTSAPEICEVLSARTTYSLQKKLIGILPVENAGSYMNYAAPGSQRRGDKFFLLCIAISSFSD
ncbi:hypothetical protein Tco_0923915 [Tanacetum coccineum]|uniref:Uncharacterized protein n=1 Tax=Tanacetum coccineum TaxID=301880 RepID=A0ABQ5D5L6_9ASTR